MIESLPLATIPAEDEALRAEVQAFLKEALAGVPPEIRARSWMGYDAEFSRKLAARAPVSAHWIADRQSGPLLLKYGTDAQKQFYLPRICKGEAFFCIGMSE